MRRPSRTRRYAPVAILLGLGWGLAVMNLDRWLVSAAQRRDRWFANVVQALPRLLIALIIGTLISTPIVLFLFQREINAELAVIHQDRRASFATAQAGDPRFARIPALQRDVANGRTALANETDPELRAAVARQLERDESNSTGCSRSDASKRRRTSGRSVRTPASWRAWQPSSSSPSSTAHSGRRTWYS